MHLSLVVSLCVFITAGTALDVRYGKTSVDCMSVSGKQSYHSLDYFLYGYNIMKGYPNQNGLDPGFTFPLFRAEYNNSTMSADCRYVIPEGVSILPEVGCTTTFTSETTSSSYEMRNSLDKGTTMSEGGFGARFSASEAYKEDKAVYDSEESLIIVSQATCSYYTTKLNTDAPPRLTDDALEWIRKIFKTHQEEPGTRTVELINSFMGYYGTHFFTNMKFGAKYLYQYKMTKSAHDEMSEKDINVEESASSYGASRFGHGSYMSDSQKSHQTEFSSQVEVKTMSIGATPPSDGDALAWASEVKQSPLPFEKRLTTITNLFSPQYLDSEDFWQTTDQHQLQELKTIFTFVLNEYCSLLLSAGSVNTCADEVPGGIFLNNYIEGILSVEDRTDYFNSSLIGQKDDRRRVQCSLDCITHTSCVAVSWMAHMEDDEPLKEGVCFLFRQGYPLKLTEAAPSGQHHVMIYPDKMNPNLFEQLRFENLYVSDSPRSSHAVQSSVDCQSLCSNDPVCAIAVFCQQTGSTLEQQDGNFTCLGLSDPQMNDAITNCNLFSSSIYAKDYKTFLRRDQTDSTTLFFLR